MKYLPEKTITEKKSVSKSSFPLLELFVVIFFPGGNLFSWLKAGVAIPGFSHLFCQGVMLFLMPFLLILTGNVAQLRNIYVPRWTIFRNPNFQDCLLFQA